MPRLPVDGKKVVEHRITLGTKERMLLESVTTGYTFNKISTPLVNIIKDASALAFIFLLLNTIFPNWSKGLPDGYLGDTEGMGIPALISYVKANSTGIKVGAGVGGILGLLLTRTPQGAAWGAGVGGTAGAALESEVYDPYVLPTLMIILEKTNQTTDAITGALGGSTPSIPIDPQGRTAAGMASLYGVEL